MCFSIGCLSNWKKISVGVADGTRKSHGKDLKTKDNTNENSNMVVEDSSTITNIESKNFSSYQKESEEKYLASKKRVKLHWGYGSPIEPKVFSLFCIINLVVTSPFKSLQSLYKSLKKPF